MPNKKKIFIDKLVNLWSKLNLLEKKVDLIYLFIFVDERVNWIWLSFSLQI